MSYLSLEEALLHGTGVERSFICGHHDDHNASASVNSLTGFWLCYACGARGKVDLTTLEVDFFAVQRYATRALEAVKAHPTYPEGWLDLYDSQGPGQYWLDRFTGPVCRSFRLGTDDCDYPVYPLRDNNGVILGVVRRRVNSGDGPKYKYPAGINVTDYLFGFHRLDSESVFLVEGATDAIALFEASGRNLAVASYGDRLSTKQLAALRKYNPGIIYLAQDQDQAGHDAAWEAGRQLHEAGLRVQRLEWEIWKDWAEMPIQSRRELLSAFGVELTALSTPA